MHSLANDHEVLEMSCSYAKPIMACDWAEIAAMRGRSRYCSFANAQARFDCSCVLNSPRQRLLIASEEIDASRGQ